MSSVSEIDRVARIRNGRQERSLEIDVRPFLASMLIYPTVLVGGILVLVLVLALALGVLGWFAFLGAAQREWIYPTCIRID